MTTDPKMALDYAGFAASVPIDRISLRDHILTFDIGAFASERGAPQRVAFTVEIDVLPPRAPLGDDVDRILSYELIVEAIEAETQGGRLNLLETLAEGIAARLLSHEQAARVKVRIEKLDLVSGRLGVEIVRAGMAAESNHPPAAATRPAIYCLCEDAHNQIWFSHWLADAISAPQPVLIAIEGRAPETFSSDAPMAQRRIDLLASEQAAWSLASKAPECIVTATRTEFEHAFKEGTATVWAPSKMIFDAQGGAAGVPEDFAQSCAWFAHEIDAASLTYVQRPAPDQLWSYDGPVAQVSDI